MACTNYQGCVLKGTYRGVPPVYIAGITGTGHFDKLGTASKPIPATSVSSARHQYRCRKLRSVRYDVNTGTGGTGTDFRTTSVSSVRRQYRYRWYRYARMYRSRYRYRLYNIDTGTGHVGKIGTTITRCRTLRYVWYDINPIPPHRDVISWSVGSWQRSKPAPKHLPDRPLGIPRL